ncbi:MAG TPA: rhomboid family intramembrane serine protease [Candidatus Binatia bacterium]|nr:rhomboid family intramembrane serine protease [Candidatus Binatia bacterium]
MRWDRAGARPFVLGGSTTPAVKALLIANVAVFLFQWVARSMVQVRIESTFGLVPFEVVHHLYLWQLVTYLFLHNGLMHIGFNMLALWMFGNELESLWGTKKFLRFYFITGIGAAILSTLVAPNSYTIIIGASGAIYGLLAAYGVLFPDRIILLYFVLPIRAKYLVLILGVITFWFSVSGTGGGVAHVAHLGGMLFGWLYLRGPRLPRLGNPLGAYERWKRNRLRKKFQVYYQRTRGEDEGPEDDRR